MDRRKFKSLETREKISQTLKEYFKDKTNHPMYGKHCSEESNKKRSVLMKEYYKTHKPPSFGKHFSEESRKKMSIARLKGINEGRIKSWNKGISMPKEIREKLSKAHIGHLAWNKGIAMSEETKRKISEANKWNTSWMKGLTKKDPRVKEIIEKSLETKRKLYKEGKLKSWNLGKHLSEETRKKLSNSRKGKSYEEIMGKEKAIQFKKRLSEIMKTRVLGKNNPMYGKTGELNPHFGKPAAHGKLEFRKDLGHPCHSKWEANYCRYLLWIKKKYQYEPKTFILLLSNGTKTSYTPDFLVDNEEWQELKGWENRSELKKWELFQQQYPQEKFVLVTRDKYKSIEKLYQYIIPNWEF